MHFEILVEDQSGKRALDILIPKLIGEEHSFIVHEYRGIGRIPKNMRDTANASKRILLNTLPKLLKGYGRTQAGRVDYPEIVILVCDLDQKCLKTFRMELLEILAACAPRPKAQFCIAIEESEAWYLGDLDAIKTAYPRAKVALLNSYVNDSICGTWEKLADAIYKGGSVALSGRGTQAVGAEKSRWAEGIVPHMNIANNRSPSFCYFRWKIQELAGVNNG